MDGSVCKLYSVLWIERKRIFLFPRLHCSIDLIPVWKPFSWEILIYAQVRIEWSYFIPGIISGKSFHILKRPTVHLFNNINSGGSFKSSASLVSVFDSWMKQQKHLRSNYFFYFCPQELFYSWLKYYMAPWLGPAFYINLPAIWA